MRKTGGRSGLSKRYRQKRRSKSIRTDFVFTFLRPHSASTKLRAPTRIFKGVRRTARLPPDRGGYAHATTCGVNKNNRPASSIVISPFEQRLRATAQCSCCNHKAARLAFECLHLTSIGAGPCSHKLHSLAAARASDVLAVMHWNMSPSCNSQGGPLGPETSPSAGTVCNNRAN
jgi:hypothetical protein